MKATIDLDDALYRRLKIEAARRGRSIRELVSEGIQAVLDEPPPDTEANAADAERSWFGALSTFAGEAHGKHGLDAMRQSIARGRKRSGS